MRKGRILREKRDSNQSSSYVELDEWKIRISGRKTVNWSAYGKRTGKKNILREKLSGKVYLEDISVCTKPLLKVCVANQNIRKINLTIWFFFSYIFFSRFSCGEDQLKMCFKMLFFCELLFSRFFLPKTNENSKNLPCLFTRQVFAYNQPSSTAFSSQTKLEENNIHVDR